MPYPSPAARFLAVTKGALLLAAVCAPAQAAFAFEVVPRPAPVHRPHKAAWLCAAAGAGLVAASFSLSDRADRRYDAYLHEADPARIDARWRETVNADRLASGSLLGGEALLVGAVWLGFLRPSPASRVALVATGDRCAVSLRF